jgi:hypothetical protein
MGSMNLTPPPFDDVVLEWLRKREPDAVQVVSVVAFGSDWGGSTEGGFYPETDVTVSYLSRAGQRQNLKVDGEDMASLWNHVMAAWPAQ